MKNKYEARLGTERMLPLVFKMALPAVAAQFVNLLYNIVDRIYIGHIPEIGTNALAGIGVTTSIVILISSFSAIVGAGGSPLAAIALGQGDRERAGKIVGNGFILLILFTIFTSLITYTFMEPILLFYRSIKIYVRICGGLSLYLFTGHSVCRDIHGLECLYQRTRASVYRYVLGFDRGFIEYRIRPYLHFLVGYGGKRRRARHDPITSLQCHMGIELPFLKTCLLAFGKAVYETGPKNRTLDVRFGNFSVHHGQYGESGGFRLE